MVDARGLATNVRALAHRQGCAGPHVRHHQPARNGVLLRGGPLPPRLEITLQKREKDPGHPPQKCKDTPGTTRQRREVLGLRPPGSENRTKGGVTRGSQEDTILRGQDTPPKGGEGRRKDTATPVSVPHTEGRPEDEEEVKRDLSHLTEQRVAEQKVQDTKGCSKHPSLGLLERVALVRL